MEAFYADYKYIRLLALQVPEGWHGALWNRTAQGWIEKGGWIHSTRDEAQRDVHEKAEAVLGETIAKLEWK